MFRKAVLSTAVAALASVAVPAHAHTDTCVFNGVMRTSDVLPAMTVASGPTVNWMMSMTISLCTSGSVLSATGDMSGSLFGTTTGTGITDCGHRFAFTGAGGVVDVAGQVVGSLSITTDLFNAGGGMALLVEATIVLIN